MRAYVYMYTHRHTYIIQTTNGDYERLKINGQHIKHFRFCVGNFCFSVSIRNISAEREEKRSNFHIPKY